MLFPKCVGCGYCCISFPCTHSIFIDKNGFLEDRTSFTYEDFEIKRCFYLYWNGSMYRCGKIEVNNEFYKYMAVGIGCLSNLNSWRKEKGGF